MSMMAVTYHLKFLQMVENLPWKALYNQHSQPSSVLYDFGDRIFRSFPALSLCLDLNKMKHFQTIFPNAHISTSWCCFVSIIRVNLQATAHDPLSQYHSPQNTLLTVQVCSSPTLSCLLPLRSATALTLHEYTHLLTLFSSSTNPSFPLQVKLPAAESIIKSEFVCSSSCCNVK